MVSAGSRSVRSRSRSQRLYLPDTRTPESCAPDVSLGRTTEEYQGLSLVSSTEASVYKLLTVSVTKFAHNRADSEIGHGDLIRGSERIGFDIKCEKSTYYRPKRYAALWDYRISS